VLALDYGRARCGCALSDPTGTLATPLEVVQRPGSRRGLARIADLVRARGAARVVVGLPLGLSGRDTEQTRETRRWAARLAAVLDVPVDLYDERLTTRLAERSGGRTPTDSRAAAHLLHDWLTRRANAGRAARGPVRA
jgi:putative Holliday junction resolvase